MEDYKKKYEELYERISNLVRDYDCVSGLIDVREELKSILNESQESEDERIMKWLIEYFKNINDEVTCEDREKITAWLEKQGEKVDAIENFNTEFERQISHLIASTINKEHEYNEDFVKWTANALLNYAKHELEKQGEHKCDCKYVGCHVNNVKRWCHKKQSEILYEKCNIKCSEYLKQGEQKLNDKVKPKFKVGDWIIGNTIYKVLYVIDDEYRLSLNIDDSIVSAKIKTIDKKFNLWTIQDAKKGDVLYHKGPSGIEYIVMSSGVNRFGNIDSYFRYNSVDGFGISVPSVFNTKEDITPATKEQRDLLFQEMKVAGYEWDDEKKELKKIEQEENAELTDFESALFSAFSDAWQEYLSGKEVNVAKWTKEHSAELLEVAREQKTAWSREDENMIENIIETIDSRYYLISDYREKISWLESLKERMKGE